MTRSKITLGLLVIAVTATPLIAAAMAWDRDGTASLGSLVFWVIFTFVTECLWIRTAYGQVTISMASSAHLAMLLVLPPSRAMLVTAVASLLAEAFVLRKPAVRVIYNASQAACAVGAAAVLQRLVAGAASGMSGMGGGAPSAEAFALLTAAVAYFAINTWSVSAAVGLSSGAPIARVWRDNFANSYELLSSAALCSIGLALAKLWEAGAGFTVALLILPVAFLKDGYERFLEESSRGAGKAGPSDASDEDVRAA